jgi:hypothetical protein
LLSGGVFTTINAPIATTTSLGGINNNGVIVGECIDGSGNTLGFIAEP